MNQTDLQTILAEHAKWLADPATGKGADLRGADLRGANLQGADLHGADLRGADLHGAELDFSCFPIWCGGTKFKADKKFVAQMLAHLCSLEVDDETRAELDKILPFARTSHRAEECGILPKEAQE